MAKAPQATATAAVPGAPKIEFGAPPPAVQRLVGASASPLATAMKAMPAPNGEKIAQFFVPATVPDSITDANERAKAGKDEARKISNRLSGISRRLMDADATVAYALRTREENGVYGVRVYRIAPTPAAPKN